MSKTYLTGFLDPSQIDIFKCALLFQRIEEEKEIYPDDPEKAFSKAKLFTFKRSLQARFDQEFSQFRNNLDLRTVETFAKRNFLKLRIWKQVNYRRPFFLEYESEVDDENLDRYRELNVFSRKFDRFNNLDFSDLSLILDIEKFSRQKKIDHS